MELNEYNAFEEHCKATEIVNDGGGGGYHEGSKIKFHFVDGTELKRKYVHKEPHSLDPIDHIMQRKDQDYIDQALLAPEYMRDSNNFIMDLMNFPKGVAVPHNTNAADSLPPDLQFHNTLFPVTADDHNQHHHQQHQHQHHQQQHQQHHHHQHHHHDNQHHSNDSRKTPPGVYLPLNGDFLMPVTKNYSTTVDQVETVSDNGVKVVQQLLLTDASVGLDVAAIVDECDISRFNSSKILPHKKRIPRQLKIPYEDSGLQLNVPLEEHKLPHVEQLGVATGMQQFRCELCGHLTCSQLNFFAHLKQHYEPSSPDTILAQMKTSLDALDSHQKQCTSNLCTMHKKTDGLDQVFQDVHFPFDNFTQTDDVDTVRVVMEPLNHVERVPMKLMDTATLNEAINVNSNSTIQQQHPLPQHSLPPPPHHSLPAPPHHASQNLVPEEFSDTEDMLEGMRDKVLIEDTCDTMDLMTPTSNGVRPHWFTNACFNGIDLKTKPYCDVLFTGQFAPLLNSDATLTHETNMSENKLMPLENHMTQVKLMPHEDHITQVKLMPHENHMTQVKLMPHGEHMTQVKLMPHESHISRGKLMPHESHISGGKLMPHENHMTQVKLMPHEGHTTQVKLMPHEGHTTQVKLMPHENHITQVKLMPHGEHMTQVKLMPHESHNSGGKLMPHESHISRGKLMPHENHITQVKLMPHEGHTTQVKLMPDENHITQVKLMPHEDHMTQVKLMPHENHITQVKLMPHGEQMTQIKLMPHGEHMTQVKLMPHESHISGGKLMPHESHISQGKLMPQESRISQGKLMPQESHISQGKLMPHNSHISEVELMPHDSHISEVELMPHDSHISEDKIMHHDSHMSEAKLISKEFVESQQIIQHATQHPTDLDTQDSHMSEAKLISKEFVEPLQIIQHATQHPTDLRLSYPHSLQPLDHPPPLPSAPRRIIHIISEHHINSIKIDNSPEAPQFHSEDTITANEQYEEEDEFAELDDHLDEAYSPSPESRCSDQSYIVNEQAVLEEGAVFEEAKEGDDKVENGETVRRKRYVCSICKRLFNSCNALKYHAQSHSGFRPHHCDICDKSFFAQGALKAHIRTHTGDKPFVCKHCNRTFRQWGDLKYHIESLHSNEKNHQCEFCGKAFSRKYSLVVHRRIHTREKNYKCEFCTKTFRASTYLQNHRKVHTGEKPYECDVCGKKFRVSGDLRRHKKTHDRQKHKQDLCEQGKQDLCEQEKMPATIIQNPISSSIT